MRWSVGIQAEAARLPDGPIVRTEAVSEHEDEDLAG